MDDSRFDRITRTIGSRRIALATAASGLASLGWRDAGRTKKKKCKKKPCKTPSGKCLCAFGEVCVDNGSCGQFCSVLFPSCPATCACEETVEDYPLCLQGGVGCEELPTCLSSADCLPGSVCIDRGCDPGFPERCVPLCTA